MTEIRVKVADFAVAGGDAILSTVGLGSCIAIVLYDAASCTGGLAHVLLPDQTMARDHSNRAKFSSTAVPLLVEAMRQAGARGPLIAKIAGGSSMFGSLIPQGAVNMGERNAIAAREAIRAAGITLVGDDTGGDYGRSVFFRVKDGKVLVRSLKRGDVVL